MYYSYEVTADYNYKRQGVISIIATLLKISGGLAMAIGLLMYRNLPWCLSLTIGGLIVAVIGIKSDNYATKLSYVWQYIVADNKLIINIRYGNGEVKPYKSLDLRDITVMDCIESDGYIVYDVIAEDDTMTVKSNKYLYALLRSNTR